jgi:cytochrome c2
MRNRNAAFWLAIGSAAALSLIVGAASAAAADDPGKTAFVANKCNLCHAVSSAGIAATTDSEKMKGPDLKGVVAEKGVDEQRKFVLRETQRDGKQHKKEYKGTREDLDVILNWLATQKQR